MQSTAVSHAYVPHQAVRLCPGQHLGTADEQVNFSDPQAQLLSALYAASRKHSDNKTATLTFSHSKEVASLLVPTAAIDQQQPSGGSMLQLRNPASVDSTTTGQVVTPAIDIRALHNVIGVHKRLGLGVDGTPVTLQDSGAAAAEMPPTPGLAFASACFPQQLLQHLQHDAELDAAAVEAGIATVDQQGLYRRPAQVAGAVIKREQAVGDAGDTATARHKDQQQFKGRAETDPSAKAIGAGQALGGVGSQEHKDPGTDLDADALQAAAQLLMLQADATASPTAEYAGLGVDIAATAASAAAAGDASAAAAGGLAPADQPMPAEELTAAGLHSADVVPSVSRKRSRKPPRRQLEQQEQHSSHQDIQAAADQDQQQQQDDSNAERRSKRARKTSYKAAEAAEAEDALAELLRPAGRNWSRAGAAGAVAGSLTATAADNPFPYSRDVSVEPDVMQAAKHQSGARIAGQQQQQHFSSADSSDQDDSGQQQQSSERSAVQPTRRKQHKQQQQQQLSDSDDDAAVKPRSRVSHNKRCVVRTSLVPIATAVQQKLQHVVSFFPDVQLPGAAHLQLRQPGSAAAAEKSRPEPRAGGCEAVAGDVGQQEQHPPSAASSPGPEAPVSAIVRDQEGPEMQQQQQQQQGPDNSSLASRRSRRTPKPVMARRSSSPAPTQLARAFRSRSETPQQEQQQQQQGENNSGMLASSGPPAVMQGSSGKNRGGRPRGSGNKQQMAPRATDKSGKAGFALRSARYTGVYQSRRAHEGWRAQFCFSNKVLNLGTYATEDDAARAWNAAALFFRGRKTWLNPVHPALPDDYVPGSLGSSVPAATATAAAEVAAKAKQ